MAFSILLKKKFVFPTIFDRIELTDDTTSGNLLYKGDSIIVVNHQGKKICNYIGNEISTLYYEYSTIQLLDGQYMILKNMRVFLPDTFQRVEFLYSYTNPENKSEQYFICSKNGMYGVLTSDGKIQLPFEYDQITGDIRSSQDYYYAIASKSNQFFCLDANMQPINKIGFDQEPGLSMEQWGESDGSNFIVQVNQKFGVYNLFQKKFIIEPLYDLPIVWNPFCHCFGSNGTLTCFNNLFEKKFKIVGESLSSTDNPELFILKKTNLQYLIKTDGTIISEGYDSIFCTVNNSKTFVVIQKNKFGCLDFNGMITTPVRYKSVCNSASVMGNFGYPLAFIRGNTVYFVNYYGKIVGKDRAKAFFCDY